MIQQKQAFRHDPDHEVYGDCARTAIACVLEIDRDHVPHFCHDGNDGMFETRVDRWLRQRGLRLVSFAYDMPLPELLSLMSNFGQTEWMLVGTSKTGCNHVVVCKGGRIAWDPSLTDAGIVGPADDGFYHVEFLVVTQPGDRYAEGSA